MLKPQERGCVELVGERNLESKKGKNYEEWNSMGDGHRE